VTHIDGRFGSATNGVTGEITGGLSAVGGGTIVADVD
jgi:hypothetical protein